MVNGLNRIRPPLRQRTKLCKFRYDLLPAKGRWQEIAQEIGVSPEALYREMARLRATGKIQT